MAIESLFDNNYTVWIAAGISVVAARYAVKWNGENREDRRGPELRVFDDIEMRYSTNLDFIDERIKLHMWQGLTREDALKQPPTGIYVRNPLTVIGRAPSYYSEGFSNLPYRNMATVRDVLDKVTEELAAWKGMTRRQRWKAIQLFEQ